MPGRRQRKRLSRRLDFGKTRTHTVRPIPSVNSFGKHRETKETTTNPIHTDEISMNTDTFSTIVLAKQSAPRQNSGRARRQSYDHNETSSKNMPIQPLTKPERMEIPRRAQQGNQEIALAKTFCARRQTRRTVYRRSRWILCWTIPKIASPTRRSSCCSNWRRDPAAQKIDAMFGGEKINVTENRAVFSALRAPESATILVDGKNVVPDVRAVWKRRRFSGP